MKVIRPHPNAFAQVVEVTDARGAHVLSTATSHGLRAVGTVLVGQEGASDARSSSLP